MLKRIKLEPRIIGFFLPALVVLVLGTAQAEFPKTLRTIALEKYALSAKPSDEKDFATLAAFLTSKAKGDKEKAWCIYRWVTDRISYNVEALLTKMPGENSAESVFKSRVCVCEGYSRLFLKLCSEAGLETVKVVGIARSGSKDDKGVPSIESHAWNAIKLDGKWEFVDSTWGSGSVDKKAFVKNFDPQFFMIPPEQIRFTHFPEDSKWQLIEQTITKEEFDKQPLLRPGFFKLGFTAANLSKAAKNPSFAGFPELFEVAGTKIKVIDAPLNVKLKAGQVFKVSIESADISKVVVLVNEKPILYIPRQGAIFTSLVKPPVGSLLIAVEKSNEKNQFSYLLKYRVE